MVGVDGEEGGARLVAVGDDGEGLGGAAVAPLHEVVTLGGVRHEGDGSEVADAGGASDGAEAGVVAATGDGVGVGCEGGYERGVAFNLHEQALAAEAVVPAVEVVAVVGCGGDGDRGAEVGAVGTGHGAHEGVVAAEVDGVAVGGEERGEGGVADGEDHEGALGGENGAAGGGPAGEVVACVGGGLKGGGLEVGDAAGTGDMAHGGVGVCADGIDSRGEGGTEMDVAVDDDVEGVGLLAGAPVNEAVAGVGHGAEGDGGEVVVGADTEDGAHGGVVVDADGECLVAEEGGEGAVAQHFNIYEAVGAAVAPVVEAVAVVGRGDEGDGGEVVGRGASGDGTHEGVVADGGDAVAVGCEEGCEVDVAVHGEGERAVGAVVAPAEEVEAVVGSGVEGDGGAVVGRVDRCGGTHERVVGGDVDSVAVDGEERGEGKAAVHRDATGIVCIAVVPMGEVVVVDARSADGG